MLQTVWWFIPKLSLFLITTVAKHLVTSFAPTLVHYKLSRHPMGGEFFRSRIKFHHTYCSENRLVSRTYRGQADNNPPFFTPAFLASS